jgi:hypothetical protein
VTTGSRTFRFVDPSPDSSKIAFYSNRSGKYEIWTTTPGDQLSQITDASDFSLLYPRWSPDGTRMTATDTTNRETVVIFDPRKPWKDQTPDMLPAPAGDGSFLAGLLQWSADGTKLAGVVNGAMTIYDTTTRQYTPVRGVRGGPVYAWLRDGRLFVGPPNAPRLVDPATGTVRTVSMPALDDPPNDYYKLSHDERSVYFPISRNEYDIWLVDLVTQRPGG